MDVEKFFNTVEIKRFFSPTRIFLGEGARNIVFDLIDHRESGILVIDKFFIEDPYVVEFKKLFEFSIKNFIIVNTEPTSNFIELELSKIVESVSYVVAIGGGSTIDTAKAIIAKLGYGNCRVRDIPYNNFAPKLYVLPTTAGSGSEVSRYYIIFNSSTGEKESYRSWSLAPNYALADVYFLRKADIRLLILCAFDAFIQLWEPFICHYERSIFNDMLVLEGISKILESMFIIRKSTEITKSLLIDLQYSSILSGISVSNVRAGIIHDAGEAISAYTKLSHPETLIIFFEEAMNRYHNEIKDREEMLIARLKCCKTNLKCYSMIDIVQFWKELFEKNKIYENIRKEIMSKRIDLNKVIERIMNDKVLTAKESPLVLTEKLVRDFVLNSLNNLL